MSMNNNPPPTRSFQGDLLALIPHLRAFALMLCHRRDLADDLVQDTLAKAWTARARFELGTNMKAWLFTILRNELYSQRRRSWRETCWDPDKAERIPAVADQQVWASELADTAHVLRSLPHSQRDAVILVAAGGFSYEEAAAICGVPVGTIKSRVARGRVALMDTLDGKTRLRRHVLNGSPSEDILAQLSALTPAGAHRTAFV
jgi:RNA polymerase sigma-70 factor (ECF subfamily)